MLREFASVPVYARSALKPGQSIQGPAVIAEDETTTIITSGFTATVRAGSPRSETLELLGQREGAPQTVSYARVKLR